MTAPNHTPNSPHCSATEVSEHAVSQRPGIGLFSFTPTVSNGRLFLNTKRLRALRHQHCLSQDEVAAECVNRRIRLSIASIKRAETGKAVLFRTAREFARFYNVPVTTLCQ